MKHVGDVVKKGLGGWEWDGVGLAVGVGDGGTEEWDEACAGAGLEFVNVTGKAQDKKNEFRGLWHSLASCYSLFMLFDTNNGAAIQRRPGFQG